MRLVTALLVKNEGGSDRYLARVLERCKEFSDDTLVLDDGSTDDTVEIAKAAGCIVKQRPQSGAWGNESPARAELWERGTKLAKDGWLLICDADMLLCGNPHPLCLSWEAQGWAFPLADCWDSEDQMRVDGPWQYGPITSRPWLFHVGVLPKNYTPHWNTRGVHCGHFPDNIPLRIFTISDIFWRHLAYIKKEHRALKHAQYQAVATQLTPFEQQHAASIAD